MVSHPIKRKRAITEKKRTCTKRRLGLLGKMGAFLVLFFPQTKKEKKTKPSLSNYNSLHSPNEAKQDHPSLLIFFSFLSPIIPPRKYTAFLSLLILAEPTFPYHCRFSSNAKIKTQSFLPSFDSRMAKKRTKLLSSLLFYPRANPLALFAWHFYIRLGV